MIDMDCLQPPSPRPIDGAPDILCFSHLRWNFVYQRPQHLMTRFAVGHRVFVYEEPLFDSETVRLEVRAHDEGVLAAVPHLPRGMRRAAAVAAQKRLLDEWIAAHAIRDPIAWFYTPMALPCARHLPASLVVYDCMDELSVFKNAPRSIGDRERELLARADLVFTGGMALYRHKRHLHPNIHGVPSSIDAEHFASARTVRSEPEDQAPIPRPRLGFYGVLDERFDRRLVDGLAVVRPDWQLVLIGPVVKIDPGALPRRPNIHYLGQKAYRDLPRYLSGWDVALLPFARNRATRFISPTKTPEYLAAGVPVVSTPIEDVVTPYGDERLVRIAAGVPAFAAACDAAMREDGGNPDWLRRVDAFLAGTSWDRTWARMNGLLQSALLRARAGDGPRLDAAAHAPHARASESGIEG